MRIDTACYPVGVALSIDLVASLQDPKDALLAAVREGPRSSGSCLDAVLNVTRDHLFICFHYIYVVASVYSAGHSRSRLQQRHTRNTASLLSDSTGGQVPGIPVIG